MPASNVKTVSSSTLPLGKLSIIMYVYCACATFKIYGIFCESFVDSTRTASFVGSAVVVVAIDVVDTGSVVSSLHS